MSRIRVAHVTAVDTSLRYLLLNQMKSIQAEGYEVIGISSYGQDVIVLESEGIKHISVNISRNINILKDLITLWQLFFLFRRERFEIVHTHTPKPGLLGQIAAKLARVPVIVNTLHGFYFHDGMPSFKRSFYILLEKVAASCSTYILSQNQEDIRTALTEGICAPEIIGHLGNGVDLVLFDPDRIKPETIHLKRAALNIPEDYYVVGFVGRLAAKRKGFMDFLLAAKQILAQRHDICFLIIGSPDIGKPDSITADAAAVLGIAESCYFVGHQPNSELPVYYKMMDLIVLPSEFEGIPRVIMEASAMGIPAVATDVKGNREAVFSGRNGVLVPYNAPSVLAEAIGELLNDPSELTRLSLQCRSIALEYFDERKVFEKILKSYQMLLKSANIFSESVCNN